MGKYVGFVDYGFLDAASAAALKVPKRRIKPDARGCVEWFRGLGPELDDSPSLLRVYWYDAQFDPADDRFKTQRRYFDGVASVPGINLRLGHLRERTPSWHYALRKALKECGVAMEEFESRFELRPEVSQKGVDTLITLDLVRLAQRRAYDTAILIAGDRDLAEPVRAAQDEGCRVLLAVPEGGGIAPELRQLADSVIELSPATLKKLVRIEPEKK